MQLYANYLDYPDISLFMIDDDNDNGNCRPTPDWSVQQLDPLLLEQIVDHFDINGLTESIMCITNVSSFSNKQCTHSFIINYVS